ncbi:uncharacterized protein LOC135837149 [Planococcus citri]|uniref:uncharacterized protein LOC135837149 n=1 Tax=Planococcus citri TaxID=170843 RepID=UPI0031F93F8A
MFNFTTKHPNKGRRRKLGIQLTEAFTDTIKNRIGIVANSTEMVDICKQPFKNAKNIHKWFLPDEYKREYYFAIDDEYIDLTSFSSELELTDIMMRNMTEFESIEVRYLSDNVTNYNLSIRNVSGNMTHAGNGAGSPELNFTMDLFQLIMNYTSTIDAPTDMKVLTNGFKVKSSINESLIQKLFEKTTASFMKSALRESMQQYNINAPLIHTITQITRHFNNKIFMDNTKSWSLSENSRGFRSSNFKITPIPASSKSNHIVCNFFDNMRINLFNYEKIIGRGENCDEYSGRISQSKNSTQYNCTFQIIIKEPQISVIHKSTESPFTELLHSEKNESAMINFTTEYLSRERQQELGKVLTEAFMDTIKTRIAIVGNPPDMADICKRPFRNATEIYAWFSPDQHEQEYYFAVDDEYIQVDNTTNFSFELKLIDIMMNSMTEFESIEVRYLSDNVTNFILSIKSVSGSMMQVGNGTDEPTELNFTMDHFQLIMNYSTIDTPTNVKVQTNGFKVRPSNNESLIQELFEKTTTSFMKRVLSNQTNENSQFSVPSLTQQRNGPFNIIGIEHLNGTYNITNQTAESIAKILWDFHNNTESRAYESNSTRINNSQSNLEGSKLTDISMNYTILGIQDETCDFEKKFQANYKDIHVVLKGSITATNISNKCFPFSLLISSLSISREKDDSGFQTKMSFDDKRIFVNTSNTDMDSSDRKTMKDIIRNYVQTNIEKTINESWRFSNLFETCKDPVESIVSKNKIEAKKYFYLISNSSLNESFHLQLRVNYIAIWGFSSYNSIETTDVRNGTSFQFVVKGLAARVNWSYYKANGLSKPMQVDLFGGSILLAGRIDKNNSTLTWEDTSRLIFKISILPSAKKKTITVEKIIQEVNEMTLSRIKKSIENSFNSLGKK